VCAPVGGGEAEMSEMWISHAGVRDPDCLILLVFLFSFIPIFPDDLDLL